MCFPAADTAGSTLGLPAHRAQDARQPVTAAGRAVSPALLWAKSRRSTLEQHSPGGNVEPIGFPAPFLVEDDTGIMCSLLGSEFLRMLQTTEPLKTPPTRKEQRPDSSHFLSHTLWISRDLLRPPGNLLLLVQLV